MARLPKLTRNCPSPARSARRRNLTEVARHSLRGNLLPSAAGLAAVLTVLGAVASGPALAAARAQEWWLTSLQVTQAWGQSEGAGITVAVLGTGVDASHPSLSGSVITGPDYSGTAARGRDPGGPFWGVEGTAVASHRRPRTRIGHHRRRAGREDPLRPGDAGIQRPAGLGPGRQPAAGGWHRRRHQVRGRPRRPDHRPAARPGDAGPDGQRRSGRGGRQPGRAGRGRRRAEQGHRAGGTRRRRRPGPGDRELPSRLPGRDCGGGH